MEKEHRPHPEWHNFYNFLTAYRFSGHLEAVAGLEHQGWQLSEIRNPENDFHGYQVQSPFNEPNTSTLLRFVAKNKASRKRVVLAAVRNKHDEPEKVYVIGGVNRMEMQGKMLLVASVSGQEDSNILSGIFRPDGHYSILQNGNPFFEA